jgi:hypothetical protein
MKPPVAATVDAIPEPILVALSAIEHAHPKWLEEDRLFKDPEGFLADQAVPQALAETLPGLSMRQVHRAGEKMFVDYAGQKPHLVFEHEGSLRGGEVLAVLSGGIRRVIRN